MNEFRSTITEPLERARKRSRFVQLPMIVSIPLLIGLLVLISGIVSKNILLTTMFDVAPDTSPGQLEQSGRLMDNLTYVSAALSALAGLILALIIVRPIRQLSSAMSDLADRGITKQVDFTRTGAEIGQLGDSFNRLMGLLSSTMPERARFLFHNIASGLIGVDGEGFFTTINSAADKMLELHGVGIRDRRVREFLSRFGEMQELIDLLEEARATGRDYSAKRVRVKTLSGREVNIIVTTTTMSDPHSGRTETLATLMDLYRIQKINEQIQQGDKLSSLGTLAAGVAHEIRNPLASLRGLTQLLGEDLVEKDPKNRYVGVILEEVDRLDGVVQQLLDFSAVSKEEKHRTDINELLQRALNLAQPALKKKRDAHVALDLAESLPPVGVFERKMVQAFLNLILNAIEAVNEDGEVGIKSRQVEDRVEVLISNTGSYIEPERRERIFDPFFTTKDKGTGLGLAITHQIVQLHEGAITCDSDAQAGTWFTLALPLRGSEETVSTPREELSAKPEN